MGTIHIPKSQLVKMCDTTRTDASTVQIATGLNAAPYYIVDMFRLVTGMYMFGSGWPVGSAAGISFFKGVPPTKNEFMSDNTINTIYHSLQNSHPYRSTDRLLHLPFSAANSLKVGNDGRFQIGTTGNNAISSGTATWFSIILSHGNGFHQLYQLYMMMGTISTPGAGGDLELVSTEIIANQFYKLNKLAIPLPTKV